VHLARAQRLERARRRVRQALLRHCIRIGRGGRAACAQQAAWDGEAREAELGGDAELAEPEEVVVRECAAEHPRVLVVRAVVVAEVARECLCLCIQSTED
jgi:hypothetical protein